MDWYNHTNKYIHKGQLIELLEKLSAADEVSKPRLIVNVGNPMGSVTEDYEIFRRLLQMMAKMKVK